MRKEIESFSWYWNKKDEREAQVNEMKTDRQIKGKCRQFDTFNTLKILKSRENY